MFSRQTKSTTQDNRDPLIFELALLLMPLATPIAAQEPLLKPESLGSSNLLSKVDTQRFTVLKSSNIEFVFPATLSEQKRQELVSQVIQSRDAVLMEWFPNQMTTDRNPAAKFIFWPTRKELQEKADTRQNDPDIYKRSSTETIPTIDCLIDDQKPLDHYWGRVLARIHFEKLVDNIACPEWFAEALARMGERKLVDQFKKCVAQDTKNHITLSEFLAHRNEKKLSNLTQENIDHLGSYSATFATFICETYGNDQLFEFAINCALKNPDYATKNLRKTVIVGSAPKKHSDIGDLEKTFRNWLKATPDSVINRPSFRIDFSNFSRENKPDIYEMQVICWGDLRIHCNQACNSEDIKGFLRVLYSGRIQAISKAFPELAEHRFATPVDIYLAETREKYLKLPVPQNSLGSSIHLTLPSETISRIYIDTSIPRWGKSACPHEWGHVFLRVQQELDKSSKINTMRWYDEGFAQLCESIAERRELILGAQSAFKKGKLEDFGRLFENIDPGDVQKNRPFFALSSGAFMVFIAEHADLKQYRKCVSSTNAGEIKDISTALGYTSAEALELAFKKWLVSYEVSLGTEALSK